MLKKSTDPHLAVFSYRATPMPWYQCGWNPVELLMGRQIRTTVPQTKKVLTPNWSYLPQFKQVNAQFKRKRKEDFDRRHCAQEQPEIPDGSEVIITTDKEPTDDRVIEPTESPRSYLVKTPSGAVCRNRSHLNIIPNPTSESDPETGTPLRRIVTRSQTGTSIYPRFEQT